MGPAPTAGELLRETRLRHGLDQRTLARRAGTTQAQISRIERGEVSPSVGTLRRLLAASGARVLLEAGDLPRNNARTEDLLRDVRLAPGTRVGQAIKLSRMLTGMRPVENRDRG